MVVGGVESRQRLSNGRRPLRKLSRIRPGEPTGVLTRLNELANVKCQAMDGAGGGEGPCRVRYVEEVRPAASEEGKAPLTEGSLGKGVVGCSHRAGTAAM